MRITRNRYKDLCYQMFVNVSTLGAMACIVAIAAYLTLSGLPALSSMGAVSFLFGGTWAPDQGVFGVLPMLLSSLAACLGAVGIALPLAVLGSLFSLRIAPRPLGLAMRKMSLWLAGLPSVVYGLLGMTLLLPAIAKAFPDQAAKNGGATLFACILVLAAVILPGLMGLCAQTFEGTGPLLRDASSALGAHTVQTIFRLELPAAKRGLLRGASFGIERALGEAMAVLLVSGNVPNMPALFSSVRLLPAGMVLEMGYATGMHRLALFSIGLIVLCMTLLLGALLRLLARKETP